MAKAKKQKAEELNEQSEDLDMSAIADAVLSGLDDDTDAAEEAIEMLAEEQDEAVEETEASIDDDAAEADAATEETAEAEMSEDADAEDDGEMPAITQDDLRLVEAILFASSTAVTVQQIAERFPEDRVKLIPDVLEMLKEHYAARGVNLVQRERRWAFRTSADLGDQMRLEKEQPKKFTRAAMETMAIVAYHQPVTRAEIENIRGVATSPGALDALMEAGWIKPGKRREVPGRPVTWLSTQAFLDHFGLEKLEDLPGMDDLKAAGLLDKRPAIEAMPTADLFGDDENKEDDMDPNEITDEDLIGKQESDDDESGFEDDDTETVSEADGGDEDDDFDDEDYDDEDGDDDADEDSDDEDADDEDSDDGDDDSDDDDSDDDEDYGDDDEDDGDFDDEDEDDDDFDDEDDEEDRD